MKLLLNSIIVKVVKDGVSIYARWDDFKVATLLSAQKWGIFLSCKTLIFFLSIADNFQIIIETSLSQLFSRLIALSKNVIDVDKCGEVVEFVHPFSALSVLYWRIRGVEVSDVAVVVNIVEKFITDQSMIVAHVEISWGAIVFPVRHTITYHETLKVGVPFSCWLCIIDISIKT